VQEEADELYGLALDEFTGARDALAKRLKADKRREDADAVSALRKPSVAAWAINQAVRGQRADADALLEAGADLREAHEAMLGGGDASEVRAASERERDAVRALTKHALAALGERASDATAEKIRATLHAVAADGELRVQVQAGRLQRESEGGAGGWPAIGDEVELADTVQESPRRAERARDRGSSKLPKSGERAERAERRSKSRPAGLSDADRRRKDAALRAQREAERAEEVAADAEASAQSARETLADAERVAREAREQAEQAEAGERAARRAVKEAEAQAERRKTEARRAVKAAKARS
jgi:hypothetical protein